MRIKWMHTFLRWFIMDISGDNFSDNGSLKIHKPQYRPFNQLLIIMFDHDISPIDTVHSQVD